MLAQMIILSHLIPSFYIQELTHFNWFCRFEICRILPKTLNKTYFWLIQAYFAHVLRNKTKFDHTTVFHDLNIK